MKKFTHLILLFSMTFIYSQNEYKSMILNAEIKCKLALINSVSEDVLRDNFKQNKNNYQFEYYNKDNDKLERVKYSDLNKINSELTQFWISTDIIIDNRVLTTFDIPFDKNINRLYSKSGILEILKPYLKVINEKTNINLEQAIEISENRGLKNINYWDIDYEKRKLVWTIKNKSKDNESRVLKINSKTGKIISDYKEIQID